MKKNMMMRLASVLLIAVLMSTCAISGTFAKYVTSGEGTDTARVAKFGVTVTANGETFAKEYNTDDGYFTEAKSVISTGDDVVAPGTSGNMASMTLTGTPEVAVRVSYVGAFDISDEYWKVDSTYYCPLIVTVNGVDFDGRAYANAAEFELSVNNAIAAYSKDYPAGTTDLSGVGADSLSVSWEWPFSTSPENDVKDTKLGNAAAAGDVIAVTLTITTTVTQID